MAKTSNIIKFGKAKKAIARTKKETQACENRVKFGRTKAQRRADEHAKSSNNKTIDSHKIERGKTPSTPQED